MADVTLRQLEYFLAVLEHGSIGEGARACHVSQANVSTALAMLEKQVRSELILRGHGRRAVPTSTGKRFAQRVRHILQGLDDATREVGESSGPFTGVFTVGCINSISSWYLPETASYFAEEHPFMSLRFVEDIPGVLENMVANGMLDSAIAYGHQLSSPELRCAVIDRVRLNAVLPANHALAEQNVVSIHDLAQEPMIMLDPPEVQDAFIEKAQSLGVAIEPAWRFSTHEAIRAFVGRGLGVSVTNAQPAPPVRAYAGQLLAYRPVKEDVFQNTVSVVSRDSPYPQDKVTALVELLKTV